MKMATIFCITEVHNHSVVKSFALSLTNYAACVDNLMSHFLICEWRPHQLFKIAVTLT